MLKRSHLVVAAIVMTAMFESAALADLAPDPIPGAGEGGTWVVAGVALVAIVAVVAIIIRRRRG